MLTSLVQIDKSGIRLFVEMCAPETGRTMISTRLMIECDIEELQSQGRSHRLAEIWMSLGTAKELIAEGVITAEDFDSAVENPNSVILTAVLGGVNRCIQIWAPGVLRGEYIFLDKAGEHIEI